VLCLLHCRRENEQVPSPVFAGSWLGNGLREPGIQGMHERVSASRRRGCPCGRHRTGSDASCREKPLGAATIATAQSFFTNKTRAGRAVSPQFCGLCTAGMGGERTTKCLAGVRLPVARERLALTRRSGYSRTRLVKAEAKVAKLTDRKWGLPSENLLPAATLS